MFSRYLTPDPINALYAAVQTLVDDDYLKARPALVRPLPGWLRALLGEFGSGAVQLMTDLGKLNVTERADDGTVPFTTYLNTLLVIYGRVSAEAANTVRSLRDIVEQEATGAPPVPQPNTREVEEAVIHQNDMVSFAFMKMGIATASAVAKIETQRYDNGHRKLGEDGKPVLFLGTGWLMAENLLITNHHVINARLQDEPPASEEDLKAQAEGAFAIFDYDYEQCTPLKIPVLELIAADPALDYAILRVDAAHRSALRISEKLPEPPLGHTTAAVNIVQHPNGDPKKFAIRNNLVASATDTELRYFTDTLGGSSGAPVFDDQWRVVALHRGHSLASSIYQGKKAVYINLGTRMSAVMRHLRETPPEKREQLKSLGL